MRYRERQIARFKVIFPEVANGSAKRRPSRAAKPPQGATGGQSHGTSLAKTEVADGATTGRPLASTKGGSAGRLGGGDTTRGGGVGRRAKFSADVAPAEMFIKDVGFTPAGVANHVREDSPAVGLGRWCENDLSLPWELHSRKSRSGWVDYPFCLVGGTCQHVPVSSCDELSSRATA